MFICNQYIFTCTLSSTRVCQSLFVSEHALIREYESHIEDLEMTAEPQAMDDSEICDITQWGPDE